MENNNEYEYDVRLSQLIDLAGNKMIKDTITDILANMDKLGYYNVDNMVMALVDVQELEDNDVINRIHKSLRDTVIKLLKDIGYGLYDSITIWQIKELLTGLVLIKKIDPDLKELVLKVIDNDSVNNNMVIAELINDTTTLGFVETYEFTEFVQDKFIDSIRTELNVNVDAPVIDDEDIIENINALNKILKNNGELIKKTYIVSLLSANEHIDGDISNYYRIIDSYIVDNKINNPDMLAAEIASLVYVYRDLEETLIEVYIKWIEDILFDDMSISDSEIIGKYVSKYIDTINKNIGDKND